MTGTAVKYPKITLALVATLVAAQASIAASGPSAPAGALNDPRAAGRIVDVTAAVETAPVESGGDAADDPAIWVHPKDPSKSVVVGTNKRGGLYVYDLAGRTVQFAGDGRMNNVDLRSGFSLGGRTVTLVTAGNRSDNTIAIYALDPETRTLANVAARAVTTADAYGSCMYRSAKTGKYYYVLANKAGIVEQWELFDNGQGKVDARRVRALKLESQAEGCAADDELGFLYVGEEAKGVWKYGADPEAGDARKLVADAGAGGPLTPDVEGIAIADTGGGKGFLIISSQGNNSFVVLRREGDNQHVKTVRVVDGPVDGVQETDGLDVTTANLGAPFAKGLLVVQDGVNDGGNQNFKYVPLDRILSE